MRWIISGGRRVRLGPLDRAVIAAIHRPTAHPFLGGLLRRLQAIEPRIVPGIDWVYEGEADGVDLDARAAAEALGIPVVPFPIEQSEWDNFGNGAGPARNTRMLRGQASGQQVSKPDGAITFAGKTGTKDMRTKAIRAGLPVIDIASEAVQSALAPLQRWGKTDAELLRTDRKRSLEVQAARPGIGPPIVSGHWFKVGGKVELPPWCLYVGRDAHGLAGHPRLHNPFPVKPLANDQVSVYLREGPVQCSRADALGYYRRHLAGQARAYPALQAELAAIVIQRRVLVCWCGESKPCHACVIAELAVAAAAEVAFAAACVTAGAR